jgi:hypothetical protein
MSDVQQVKPTQDTRIDADPNAPVEALGTPEAVNAALQKADSGLDPNKLSSLLAGKYKTVEDVHRGIASILPKVAGDPESAAKLYKLLEARMGTPVEQRGEIQLPDPIPPAEPSADMKGTEPSEPSGEAPPIDLAELGAEFGENNGQLKPASYERLAKAGFNRSMVDTYLLGLRAQVDGIYAAAGGKETYTEMLDWGVENYSEADRQAFDEAIKNGSNETRKAAIDMLKARFTQSRGPLKTVTPQSAPNNPSGASGFASRAEYIEALRDPRYGKDPAYEQAILRRLSVSRNI